MLFDLINKNKRRQISCVTQISQSKEFNKHSHLQQESYSGIAKTTALCALYNRLFYPDFFTPTCTSTTLCGFDSEQIFADRIQRIDRMLILNVANSCVASTAQYKYATLRVLKTDLESLHLLYLMATPPLRWNPREHPHILYISSNQNHRHTFCR